MKHCTVHQYIALVLYNLPPTKHCWVCLLYTKVDGGGGHMAPKGLFALILYHSNPCNPLLYSKQACTVFYSEHCCTTNSVVERTV